MLVMPKPTLANPHKFKLAEKYECNIERDNIFFDPEANLDVLQVDMVIKKIDDQDIASEFLMDYRIFAIQGNTQLDECTSKRNDYYESNFQNMDVSLNPDEKKQVVLYFYLLNDKNVNLLFFNNAQVIEQEVDIPIKGRESIQSWLGSKAKNAELRSKQSLKSVELNCIKVYLTDDWYADSKASVNIKIKNSKSNGTIDIDYDSAMNAENLIKQHAVWLSYNGQVSQIDINDRIFYIIQPTDESFVLTTDASNGYSIKITGSNTNLDKA